MDRGFPAPKGRGCSVRSCSRGNRSPGHAASFMHEQRKVPKERCLKSVASTASRNSEDFKVSHYPSISIADLFVRAYLSDQQFGMEANRVQGRGDFVTVNWIHQDDHFRTKLPHGARLNDLLT
jgi:hypothetical protein